MQRLKDEAGRSTARMVERYAKRMNDAYRQDIIDWWGGKVVLALGEAA